MAWIDVLVGNSLISNRAYYCNQLEGTENFLARFFFFSMRLAYRV